MAQPVCIPLPTDHHPELVGVRPVHLHRLPGLAHLRGKHLPVRCAPSTPLERPDRMARSFLSAQIFIQRLRPQLRCFPQIPLLHVITNNQTTQTPTKLPPTRFVNPSNSGPEKLRTSSAKVTLDSTSSAPTLDSTKGIRLRCELRESLCDWREGARVRPPRFQQGSG